VKGQVVVACYTSLRSRDHGLWPPQQVAACQPARAFSTCHALPRPWFRQSDLLHGHGRRREAEGIEESQRDDREEVVGAAYWAIGCKKGNNLTQPPPVLTQPSQLAASRATTGGGATPAGRATPAGGATPDAAGSSQAAMATPVSRPARIAGGQGT
jgi:hypothetical protein